MDKEYRILRVVDGDWGKVLRTADYRRQQVNVCPDVFNEIDFAPESTSMG